MFELAHTPNNLKHPTSRRKTIDFQQKLLYVSFSGINIEDGSKRINYTIFDYYNFRE